MRSCFGDWVTFLGFCVSLDPFHKGANELRVTHLPKPSFFLCSLDWVEGWPRCALGFDCDMLRQDGKQSVFGSGGLLEETRFSCAGSMSSV